MTNPDEQETGEDFQIGDFFAPLRHYGHLIWHATVAVTAMTIIGGGIYFFWQPVRWTASMDFRPVFASASSSRYPNDLPFSSTDVVNSSVLDQVYDRNRIEQYCGREDFRAGFFVEETSPELQFLDQDYQARLSDAKLTVVDRERLQSDYRARRQTLVAQYRLAWLRPDSCSAVPPDTAFKSLTEVLQTWAEDSERKRGVLNFNIGVLSPSIFDFAKTNEHSPLVRVDLIRSALSRVIANIQAVQAMPGAGLVRIGKDPISFIQLRTRVEDLQQADLTPLIAVAGRGLGADAVHWAEQSLAEAIARNKAAEDRAAVYQMALREYTGSASTPPQLPSSRSQANSNDVQNLTPLIDKTFVDRIGELSAPSTAFRVEMTREMVKAKVAAVETASAVEHYRQLGAALKSGAGPAIGAEELERRLTAIVDEGKELVRQFNALYEEYSRVSLRPGPMLYRVESQASARRVRAFNLRNYALWIMAAAIITPVVLALGALLHHAVRSIAGRPLRA